MDLIAAEYGSTDDDNDSDGGMPRAASPSPPTYHEDGPPLPLDDFDGHGAAEHSAAMSEHIGSKLVFGCPSTTNMEVRTAARSGRREASERDAPQKHGSDTYNFFLGKLAVKYDVMVSSSVSARRMCDLDMSTSPRDAPLTRGTHRWACTCALKSS